MKKLIVEFYPPLKSGEPAPYEPLSVKGLSMIERDSVLKRSFISTMRALEGKNMVISLSEFGRAVIANPSPQTRETVNGIPYVAHAHEYDSY